MTAIAYRNGIIASDSQITSGDTIQYTDFKKHFVREDVNFFFAGPTCDYQKLMDLYFGTKHEGQITACALVLDEGNLLFAAVDPETGFWKMPVLWDQPYAIGSGAPFAYGAMDFGASAKEAIEIASRRDVSTGGVIYLYDLVAITKEIQNGRSNRVQATGA